MNFDFSPIADNWRFFASGLGMTVLLSIVSAATSLLAGLVIALLRLYGPRWLRPLLVFYIDSMRAIPVLVVLIWIYFAFPIIANVTFPPFWAALVALTLHIAAYAAEVIRAGIESIRPGQTRAALALGMSRRQAMFKVLIPQAGRRILPVLASTRISLFKDTSLVSVIAVSELAYASMQVRAQSFRVLEMLTAMAVIYWLMGYPQAKLVDWIHRKYGVKE